MPGNNEAQNDSCSFMKKGFVTSSRLEVTGRSPAQLCYYKSVQSLDSKGRDLTNLSSGELSCHLSIPLFSFVAALILRLSFEAEICKAVFAVQQQPLQSDCLALGLNLILKDHHPGYKLLVLLQTMSMSAHGTPACLIRGL